LLIGGEHLYSMAAAERCIVARGAGWAVAAAPPGRGAGKTGAAENANALRPTTEWR
jgi:hypothetical protein